MDIPLLKIAELVNGEIIGDVKKNIKGISSFDDAGSDEITFAGSPDYLNKVEDIVAGAVIISCNADKKIIENTRKNLVLVENPQTAFMSIVPLFSPPAKAIKVIDSSVNVGKAFTFGDDLSIGASVVIGDNVSMGDRVEIMPGSVISNNVTIGDDVKIYPNVTILRGTKLGNRVIIHSGTVIGSDGFGFTNKNGKHIKIMHVGIVQIDNDVEIGAGNTIDRGTFGKTWIKNGVKTDNQVHIAHNVTVGENTLLVAQVGIAGSTFIGNNVIIAGQAGVSGHLRIEDGAIVGPAAGIVRHVLKGSIISGTPGIPHKLWLRVQSILPKLPDIRKKVLDLEKRIKSIENKKTD